MIVRAKMVCTQVNDQPDYKQKDVHFSAVISGSEENKSFSKYTPSANMTMYISHETPAADFFEPGKEYYLDFTKAE